MIAIVIGYKTPGPQGEFEILYSGRDATAAQEICVTPPVGFCRTEMFKNPPPLRRRYHVQPEVEPEPEEPEQESEEPSRRKK